MKFATTLLLGCLVVAVLIQTSASLKCADKPADDEDATVIEEIKDCAAELLEGKDDADADASEVVKTCVTKITKALGKTACAGKTKAMAAIKKKMAELGEKVQELLKSGDGTDAAAKLKEGFDNLAKEAKKAFKTFKSNLKKAGKEMAEFKDE